MLPTVTGNLSEIYPENIADAFAAYLVHKIQCNFLGLMQSHQCYFPVPEQCLMIS